MHYAVVSLDERKHGEEEKWAINENISPFDKVNGSLGSSSWVVPLVITFLDVIALVLNIGCEISEIGWEVIADTNS